jgi:RHS repeat-associated protein
LAITSDAGVVLEQRHFDAWGILTHGEIKLIDRGYTSHEHLQDVGIIHMNGRLYDPLMRRFLNADENIQDPYNTQNYNKYGYVMNNPLLFNDPSGEIIFLGITMALVVKAMIIGAIVSSISYTVGLAVTGNLNQASAGGALKALFFGTVSAAVTFGIGSLFSSVGANGIQTATSLGKALGGIGSPGVIFVGAACHAVAQGALSMMQGGKFLSGAAPGFLGHLGGAAWGASMKGLGLDQFAGSTGGIITFGALSGGVGAELTGGNFWTGAVTGGIVAGLNTAFHKIGTPPGKKNLSPAQEAQIKARQKGGFYKNISDAKKYPGIEIYQNRNPNDDTAVTLPGNAIYIGGGYKGDELTMVMQHEYGHYLQYKEVGMWDFYTKIGYPSLTSTGNHQVFWTETWANRLAYNFFGNNIHPKFTTFYPL